MMITDETYSTVTTAISLTPYYFAYGMNTNPEQMRRRTDDPLPIGSGSLNNHAFRFAIHADVYPKDGEITHGVLWKITAEQLANLDIREGYPFYYDRKIVHITCGNEIYSAWMYYMTPGHQASPPSPAYLNMIIDGFKAFSVPDQQIYNALRQFV